MTLASLFRPAAAPEVLPGRHAAPDDDERRVVSPGSGPGRHAAYDDEWDESEEDGDLLESLGFDYEDDDEDDDADA